MMEKQFILRLVITQNDHGWWCEHEIIPNDVAEGNSETTPQEAVIDFINQLKKYPNALLPPTWQPFPLSRLYDYQSWG